MRTYLINLRKKAGLTQTEAAENLSISRAFYGMIETSARNPTLELANRIAEFYNSNLNDIFFDAQASNSSKSGRKEAS